MAPPQMLMILTENHTMLDPRDMRALIELARIAEDSGFDAVMVSEQTMLGPDAAINGLMSNPRMYAAVGNQDPMTPWPSSVATLAAVAAATSRVRIVAGAIIPPLRHPILLAKDLATIDLLCEGRLVVQPTVSWQRAEYEAHGVPFSERGRILDEHLEAMSRLWAGSPASFEGRYFSFTDAYCEPKAWRPTGPRMWFGGEWMHPALIRRMARYGTGFHPFGAPTAEDLAQLAEGLAAVGRDISEIELIGGTRATFASPDAVADVDDAVADVDDAVADVDDAMAAIDEQVAAGYTLFCMKPSQYTDDITEVAGICRRMVDYCARLEAERVGGAT